MKTEIDFYYWGNICPITSEIIELLNKYQDVFKIKLYDITYNFELSKSKSIFYPFLTVINKTHRFYSPISNDFLKNLSLGVIPTERPYRPILGKQEKSIKIIEINENNYSFASKCTAREKCKGGNCKIKMYNKINENIFGFMNIENNILLGGVEFFPSKFVPYDIPKADDIAFITCVYLSHEKYDYKTPPLKVLEKYLSDKYNKIVVISDEIGVFPNGDLEFFKRNGYKDEKVVFEDDYCKLHLLSKNINENFR